MFIDAKLARMKNRLPWRVRRRLERLQFRFLRFARGLSELHIRNGSASASLVAVGDVALAGSVEASLQFVDAEQSLERIRPLLTGCDLRLANLETVLTDADMLIPSIGSVLKASPSAVRLLTAARFDIVTLANNHARDCRLPGLLQCLQVLDDHGIQHCGAGLSLEQARSPAIIEVAGVKVGVLGYCDNFRVDPDEAENFATAPARDDWIVSDILALRSKADLVVLQLHWGWEFSFYPLLNYRNRARRFAEMGADLVLCHHAHLPMGVEVWRNSIIVHGLGNFIFPLDTYLSSGHPWAYRSFALKVFFDKSGVLRARVFPYTIDRNGFPTLAAGSATSEILGCVGRASARLHDDLLLAWVERDRTLRTAMSYFGGFSRCDLTTAQEWALQLRSPFQQDNISRLGQNHGTAGKRLSTFMQEVAENSADAKASLSLSRQCREDKLVSVVANLRFMNPVPDDLPGRVP